jgi:hypothetical protein
LVLDGSGDVGVAGRDCRWPSDQRLFEEQRDAVWALWSAKDPVELRDATLTPLLDRLERLERLLRRR